MILDILSKPLPASDEIEHAVLGCMIYGEPYCSIALDALTKECFVSFQNHLIFCAVKNMTEKKCFIDLFSVCSELKSLGLLEQAGGHEHILLVTNSYSTVEMLPEYIKILKQKSYLRGMLRTQNELCQACFDENFEKVSESIQKINDLQDVFQIGKKEYYSAKDYFPTFIETLEEKRKQKEPELKLGFSQLDNLFWGLHKGEVLTIGARTGKGKSVFLLNVANSLIRQEKKVLYFSTEMSVYEKWSRLMTIVTGISASAFRNCNFSPDEVESIIDRGTKLSEKDDFFVCDTVSPTMEQIRSVIKKVKPDVVMLDYLGLFSLPTADRKDLQIGEFMKNVKIMAREQKVCVLVASQLNRQVDNRTKKIPTLSDLKESGSIEQESDIVILLYDEEEKSNFFYRKIVIASVEKNRHGKTGIVRLGYNFENLSIEEIEENV